MIQEYSPNFHGTHTVRVTFMQWEYVGHVAFRIGGNCMGADLLTCDFLDEDTQECINNYVENDCHFTYNEDEELYHALLKNAEGDELSIEGDGDELRKMIVSIEFSMLEPNTAL